MSGTVLLTGATGFVGTQVLNSLAAAGTSVRVVVRSGREDAVAARPGVESVRSTSNLFAEDAAWWASACAGVDTVVHIAWYAESGQYLQSSANLDCLVGTLEAAKGAAQAGVRRFVGTGTCFEYDLAVGALSVDTPLKPVTVYAASKVAAFLTLTQYFATRSIEFAWCRLFYLFGEGEDPRRLVPYLRARLAAGEPAELSSGNQLRDFMDVRDAGRMLAETALGRVQGPVNVCSGVGITVRELAERIADEFGRRDLLRFGARPDNLVDPPRVVGVLRQAQP